MTLSTLTAASGPAIHEGHAGPHGHDVERPAARKFLRKAAFAAVVFGVPPAAALALGAGASTAGLLFVLSLCVGSHLFMGHGGHGGRSGHGAH